MELHNVAPLDRYTSAHVGFGALLAKTTGMPWWAALTTSLLWELAENRFKTVNPELFPRSALDSLANTVADTGAVMLGFAAARHLMAKGAPRDRAAVDAAVASTVGAFAGSVGFGLAAKGAPDRARVGYGIGGAVGGAVGGARESAPAAVAGAAGGGVLGPVGAALLAYLAAGA